MWRNFLGGDWYCDCDVIGDNNNAFLCITKADVQIQSDSHTSSSLIFEQTCGKIEWQLTFKRLQWIIISLVKDKLSCRLSVCLYCSCVLSVILIWELGNRNWLSTTCTLGPAEWLGWGGSGTGGQLCPGPYDDISMFGVLSWAWVSWASDLWLVADNVDRRGEMVSQATGHWAHVSVSPPSWLYFPFCVISQPGPRALQCGRSRKCRLQNTRCLW